MNNFKLILSEGKTDAILLSYYLSRTCGWNVSKAPKGLNIRTCEDKGESAYWYKREDEFLLICGVGGKDCFEYFFNKRILPIMTDSSTTFSKFAVVTDRDDRDISSILDSFKVFFQPIISVIENNEWSINSYKNSYDIDTEVEFLPIIIPTNKEGALETLLLDAISEDEYDKVIVEKSIEFINQIQPDARKYIKKDRLKLKAYIAVTWAIQYPEKVFSHIDSQIKSVKWEDSETLDACFRDLKNI